MKNIRYLFLNRLGGISIATAEGITGNFATDADAAATAALDPGVEAVLMLDFDTAIRLAYAHLDQADDARDMGELDKLARHIAVADALQAAAAYLVPDQFATHLRREALAAIRDHALPDLITAAVN